MASLMHSATAETAPKRFFKHPGETTPKQCPAKQPKQARNGLATRRNNTETTRILPSETAKQAPIGEAKLFRPSSSRAPEHPRCRSIATPPAPLLRCVLIVPLALVRTSKVNSKADGQRDVTEALNRCSSALISRKPSAGSAARVSQRVSGPSRCCDSRNSNTHQCGAQARWQAIRIKSQQAEQTERPS
jgi:hypothetical protein